MQLSASLSCPYGNLRPAASVRLAKSASMHPRPPALLACKRRAGGLQALALRRPLQAPAPWSDALLPTQTTNASDWRQCAANVVCWLALASTLCLGPAGPALALSGGRAGGSSFRAAPSRSFSSSSSHSSSTTSSRSSSSSFSSTSSRSSSATSSRSASGTTSSTTTSSGSHSSPSSPSSSTTSARSSPGSRSPPSSSTTSSRPSSTTRSSPSFPSSSTTSSWSFSGSYSSTPYSTSPYTSYTAPSTAAPNVSSTSYYTSAGASGASPSDASEDASNASEEPADTSSASLAEALAELLLVLAMLGLIVVAVEVLPKVVEWASREAAAWSGTAARNTATTGPSTQAAPWTVAQVQVATLAVARELKARINELGSTADTSTPEGLHTLLQEAVLALLRHPSHCVLAHSSATTAHSAQEAEHVYNELSLAARAAYDEDTLVNYGGRQRRQAQTIPGSSGVDELLVVSLVVAGEGAVKLPPINSWDDLQAVLKRLAALSPAELKAVQLTWTPQAEGDALSMEEVVRRFPQLQPLAK